MFNKHRRETQLGLYTGVPSTSSQKQPEHIFSSHDKISSTNCLKPTQPTPAAPETATATASTMTTQPPDNPESQTPATPSSWPRFFRMPAEIRNYIFDLILNTEHDGEVDFEKPCLQRNSLPLVSKEVLTATHGMVQASGGNKCFHINFQITLPTMEQMPQHKHKMQLLQAIAEKDKKLHGGHGQVRDISQAEVLIFKTGHLSADAPDRVICYLERGSDFASYEIQGGTEARYQAVEETLREALARVKNTLTTGAPVVVTAGSDDEKEDPGVKQLRLQREAMTYLAECVRIAVCEEIEEPEEPRLLGP